MLKNNLNFYYFSLVVLLSILSCSKKIDTEKENQKRKQVYCLSKENISQKDTVFLLSSEKNKYLTSKDIKEASLNINFENKPKNFKSIHHYIKGSCLVFNTKIKGKLKITTFDQLAYLSDIDLTKEINPSLNAYSSGQGSILLKAPPPFKDIFKDVCPDLEKEVSSDQLSFNINYPNEKILQSGKWNIRFFNEEGFEKVSSPHSKTKKRISFNLQNFPEINQKERVLFNLTYHNIFGERMEGPTCELHYKKPSYNNNCAPQLLNVWAKDNSSDAYHGNSEIFSISHLSYETVKSWLCHPGSKKNLDNVGDRICQKNGSPSSSKKDFFTLFKKNKKFKENLFSQNKFCIEKKFNKKKWVREICKGKLMDESTFTYYLMRGLNSDELENWNQCAKEHNEDYIAYFHRTDVLELHIFPGKKS